MAEVDQDGPDEADDEVGRPVGKDEIDPELVRLPRPKARLGWLLALSVLIFCCFYLLRLRSDLVFSRAGDTPTRLDEKAVASGDFSPDTFVELTAQPDRASLFRVAVSDSKDGHRLVPVLGSSDRLWILLHGSHWYETNVYDEVYRGRVKRLGDLPFYDSLLDYLDDNPPAPRLLPLESLAEFLAERASPMDVGGDVVPVSEATPVVVSERVAGRAIITGFNDDALTDEKRWRQALAAAGFGGIGTTLVGSTDKSWTFSASAPGGVDSLSAQLVAAKLYAARAEPFDRAHRTTWGSLALAGDSLQVSAEPAHTRIPLASVLSVELLVSRTAPADAFVIITTDKPGDFWYVLPLYVVFALFALLFAWALWRAVRPDRKETSS